MRPGPGGSFALPAGSPTSGAHPINASRNCASFDGARGFWERGAPHLTVMATPLSPDLRRGAPRSVELRCEAFVFFPSVDFYSRPREMRSGELPRLRPPRVESWRARRGGLEGAGKSGGGFPSSPKLAKNDSTTPMFTQRIASGSGAPGANAVSRSCLSASVTGHFSLAAVVWNQVMTVVKGQSQGCLACVWNSLPLR